MNTEQDNIQILDDSGDMEIDLLDLGMYYLSKIKIIIAMFLAGALVAGIYTYYCITPLYTATAKMYMVSASNDSVVDLTDLNIGTSLSSDYAVLMKTRPIGEAVIKDLKLDYTYDQLMGMIDISVIPDTRIIAIAVTSADPQEAKDIANAMTIETKKILPKVMDTSKPNIAESAILPQHKSSPSLAKNTAIGALIATVLCLGFFTIGYLKDDTFKTAEDIEKAFGVMPLSVIPEVELIGSDKAVGKGKRHKKKFGKRK